MGTKSKKPLILSTGQGQEGRKVKSSFKGEIILELLGYEFILKDKGKAKRRIQAERLGYASAIAWKHGK